MTINATANNDSISFVIIFFMLSPPSKTYFYLHCNKIKIKFFHEPNLAVALTTDEKIKKYFSIPLVDYLTIRVVENCGKMYIKSYRELEKVDWLVTKMQKTLLLWAL